MRKDLRFFTYSFSKIELIIIAVLLSVTVILRFPQLGYSHFYGDETKAIFYNKSISITDFLLDQRKGPLQFVITWLTENTFNGFNEKYIRLPFAMAGSLSVLVFYLIVRNLFGWKEAVYASFLFTLSGFNIAFSRTAQYQSILILFCLISLFLCLLYTKNKNLLLLLFSSFFLALGILTHYDTLFFAIPISLISFKLADIKTFTIYFLLPIIILSSVFYGPYIIKGYFSEKTQNYVMRRITGQEYRPSSSVYTLKVYNPDVFYILLLIFSCFYFANGVSFKKIAVFCWFLIPFIVFELIFQNPGTHTNNYLIPLYVMSGVGFVYFIENYLVSRKLKKLFFGAIITILVVSFFIKATVYIPLLNTGYPWKDQQALYKLRKANNSYHLYLYGFPYYRGWDLIRNYMLSQMGVRGIYTNDNSTLAEYYLREFDITPPGSNYLPQYYIDVIDNQEFKLSDPVFLSSYSVDKEIFVDGKLNATIYKKPILVL